MKNAEPFISALALILILIGGILPLAAAPALGLERGLGWDAAYFLGLSALLLAVWLLAQDQRTCSYLMLSVMIGGLLACLPLLFVKAGQWGAEAPLSLPLGIFICLAWLPAAATTVSAAARRIPAGALAPDRLKKGALLLILAIMACRLVLLKAGQTYNCNGVLCGPHPVLLLLTLLIFIPPLWLLRAAGRRADLIFMAGLTGLVPLLMVGAAWLTHPPDQPGRDLYRSLYMFNAMHINIMLTLFILTALLALRDLIAVRGLELEPPEPEPARRQLPTLADLAAGRGPRPGPGPARHQLLTLAALIPAES